MNESESNRLNPTAWYLHEGVSFMRDSAAKAIDIATYHLHDSDWNPEGGPDWALAFITRFVGAHARQVPPPIDLSSAAAHSPAAAHVPI